MDATSFFSPVDYLALSLFLASWFGYVRFAGHRARSTASLFGVSNSYRREWMERLVLRENRIMDAALLAGLSQSATFLASTTVLILGGLIAMLGTTDTVMEVVSELPLAVRGTRRVWEMKILFLLGIFVFAFFKFTWSMRQFNTAAILVGAAPLHDEPRDPFFVERAAEVLILAGENFNNGLRTYYFGLAAMTWLLHPWLLMLATGWVVYVLYVREFRSRLLKTLIAQRPHTEVVWPPPTEPSAPTAQAETK